MATGEGLGEEGAVGVAVQGDRRQPELRDHRGEVVGHEGSTGKSNGCHLHFEVYEDGEFVDPRNYL